MSIRLFGSNNNQLFKNKSKNTYSMPQKYPLNEQIIKCACGYDYVAVITQSHTFSILYQAHLYPFTNIPKVIDIATSDNTIMFLTVEGHLYIWQFDYEKLNNNTLKPTKIELELEEGDSISQIEMGYRDVFLLSYEGKVYHFQKNQWYETKTYSQIQCVELSKKIVDVSSGEKKNIFLTYEGQIFYSLKDEPLKLKPIKTNHRFLKISASTYYAAVSKKGVIVIWGKSMHGNFQEPTQFTKLAKKFISVKLNKENGYAITDDGQLWVWGTNSNGELGLSDYEPRIKPFPLITLQKYFIQQVYGGENYTCVLCQRRQTQTDRIQIKGQRVSELELRENNMHPQVRKREKGNKAKQVKFREGQLNKSKQISGRKHKRTESISVDKRSKSNNLKLKNISNIDHNRSKSIVSCPKSPVSARKVPNGIMKKKETPNRTKNNKQTGRHHSQQSQLQSSNRIKINKEIQKEKERQAQNQIQIQKEKQQNYVKTITSLQTENKQLKNRVEEQNQLIQDITSKIRLLEQAIQEHEVSLTSRDNLVQEYQNRQKEYQIHIEELQKSIESLVKGKQKNSEITIIYEDLKTNFEKERQYYIQKIKDYEERAHTLMKENGELKKQICNLSRELDQRQKQNEFQHNQQEQSSFMYAQQTPQIKSPWKVKEMPISKIEKTQNKEYSPLQDRNMQEMINRIQSNKNRISKSANKLIAMLDMQS